MRIRRNFDSLGTSSRRASCSKTVRSGIVVAPDSMGISIVGGSGIGCWMADRAAEGAKRLLDGAVSGWSGGEGRVTGNGKRCALRFDGILVPPFTP